MFSQLVEFIRDKYQTIELVPLHAPLFIGNERRYVDETIESTFVSSVGSFVTEFEEQLKSFTGSRHGFATVNGTAALHASFHLAGVSRGDLVLTQALTFVATCNALHHIGAQPVFLDVSRNTLGLCPQQSADWLAENAELDDAGVCRYRASGARISAMVPMHTFGHPAQVDKLQALCERWNIILIEDAAEALGSRYLDQHLGTFGEYGTLSFNGNKIITTGSGGMVLCRTREAGERGKHLTTTAKVQHPWDFFHDEAGFNYRLANLNAALGCAQMEMLPRFLESKRALAQAYSEFFSGSELDFFSEAENCRSNYWLNAVICPDHQVRNDLLEQTNKEKVMTRPVWKLMHRLPMYENAIRSELPVSEMLEARLVNLPSSPLPGLSVSDS